MRNSCKFFFSFMHLLIFGDSPKDLISFIVVLRTPKTSKVHELYELYLPSSNEIKFITSLQRSCEECHEVCKKIV